MPLTLPDLQELYRPYSETIKPLIALIEAEREEFPLPLYNEIRALNDHVARALAPAGTLPDEELEKARRHIARINLDCFKWLNITFAEKLETFRKDLRNVDLTKINNGEFYSPFKAAVAEAKQLVRDAKISENKGDSDGALCLYQAAFNKYAEAVEMTQSVDGLTLKRIYSKTRPLLAALSWILLVLIGWALDKLVDAVKAAVAG